MTESSRTQSTTTYVAVAVSLLALLVATTSTAYAAGLAKNSVGSKQLKSNAVKTVDIKNGAVTTAKLAAGVVPAKTVHVTRHLPISAVVTPLLRLEGLSIDEECSALAQDTVKVTVTRTGGGTLTVAGVTSLETSTADATASPYVDDQSTQLQLWAIAPGVDAFATMTFDGVVTAAGHRPVQLQLAVQVDDGLTTPCQTYVTATPIG